MKKKRIKLPAMKKSASLVLSAALLLSVSLLAGCGSAAKEPAASDTASAAPQTQSAANAETNSAAETGSNAETAPATETASTAADSKDNADAAPIRVMALKGPTAMGMVKLMDTSEAGAVNGNSYEFTIAASPDEVTPKLVQGEADIAAVPANLASVLYNNTEGQVQVLAINTLGVLYIVENGETVKTASDLRGKTIYASGKGSTPEYALNYILSENGIEPAKDVTIEWKSEHSECVAALAGDPSGIAMLPQPFVTTAQTKNDKLRVALDLTKEWEALQEGAENPSALVTGVVVVRSEFAAQHPEEVNAFLDSYRESVEYVNSNIDDAASLIEKYDIVPAAVAKKALPYCNITFLEGSEMKSRLSGYLKVLKEQNPKAVGGSLPSDDFYYER